MCSNIISQSDNVVSDEISDILKDEQLIIDSNNQYFEIGISFQFWHALRYFETLAKAFLLKAVSHVEWSVVLTYLQNLNSYAFICVT